MNKHIKSIYSWQSECQDLELYKGKIRFISEDDEDMIEISYKDGMLIDVGKPTSTNYYCITVVSSNDINGWKNPVEEILVNSKEDLVRKIQETILKYRQD